MGGERGVSVASRQGRRERGLSDHLLPTESADSVTDSDGVLRHSRSRRPNSGCVCGEREKLAKT